MNRNSKNPIKTVVGNTTIYNYSTTSTKRLAKFFSAAIGASKFDGHTHIVVFGDRDVVGIWGWAFTSGDIEIHIGSRTLIRKRGNYNKKLWLVLLHEIGHILDHPLDKYGTKYATGYTPEMRGLPKRQYNKLPPEIAANNFARKIIKNHKAPQF